MDKPRPRIRPALVLFPLGLGTALSLMGDGTLYTVLPTHTVDAGIAGCSIAIWGGLVLSCEGILLAVNRAVRILLNGPAGLAYDRLPRRWLFIASLFLGALSTVLYAATRGFWPLFAGRLLWGLAWSGIWVGGATVILDVTTSQDRGRWSGFYQTWFFVGAALSTFVGGLLTDLVGYATTMWIGAGLTALGGLVALFLLPETRRPHAEGKPSQPEVEPRTPLARGLWVVASLYGVNRFAIAGVLISTMGLLVRDRLSSIGLPLGVATLTGLLLAGRTVLSIASAPLAGIASDRLGNRWPVLGGTLLAGAVSMALLAWPAPAAILAGIALGSASTGGLQALSSALTGDLVGLEQRGRAIGLVQTVGDLGSALGPLTAYALLEGLGLTGIYLLCAALFALQLAVVWWFRWYGRRSPGRTAEPPPPDPTSGQGE